MSRGSNQHYSSVQAQCRRSAFKRPKERNKQIFGRYFLGKFCETEGYFDRILYIFRYKLSISAFVSWPAVGVLMTAAQWQVRRVYVVSFSPPDL